MSVRACQITKRKTNGSLKERRQKSFYRVLYLVQQSALDHFCVHSVQMELNATHHDLWPTGKFGFTHPFGGERDAFTMHHEKHQQKAEPSQHPLMGGWLTNPQLATCALHFFSFTGPQSIFMGRSEDTIFCIVTTLRVMQSCAEDLSYWLRNRKIIGRACRRLTVQVPLQTVLCLLARLAASQDLSNCWVSAEETK